MIGLTVTSPTYDGPTYPSWLKRHAKLPWVDAIACRRENQLSIIVVNRSEDQKASIDIQVSGLTGQTTQATVYRLGGPANTKNTFEEQPISVAKSVEEFNGRATLEPCSLEVYVLQI